MRIIMLAGKANTGKTTTLNNVAGILKKKGAKIEDYNDKEVTDIDILAEYKGKTIRIHSSGDILYVCKEVLSERKKGSSSIDILVIAYRSAFSAELDKCILYGETKNEVIKKNKATDADNDRALNEIISSIEKCIAETRK